MKKLSDVAAYMIGELARMTTALAHQVFDTRGMLYPHPAETSKVVKMTPELYNKYEPLIKEHYLKEEERLAREETTQGLKNQPGMGGR